MAISREMRRLQTKWASGHGWPKKLEFLEISGLRGWMGERVDFQFPIVAGNRLQGVGCMACPLFI